MAIDRWDVSEIYGDEKRSDGEWVKHEDHISRVSEVTTDLVRALEACLNRMVEDGYHSDEVEQAQDALADVKKATSVG